jgi:GGDEF domain-containing protein
MSKELDTPPETIEALTKKNEELHGKLIKQMLIGGALLRGIEKRKDEANRDSLTGLLNRRGFQVALDKTAEIAGVIVLDIDNFKQINDTFGHNRGDEAIRMIADILYSSVREQDIVARVGGDEFVIVLSDDTQIDLPHAAGEYEARQKPLTEKSVINALPYMIASRLRREMAKSENDDLRDMAFPLGVTTAGRPATKATLEEALQKADDEVRAIKSQRSLDQSYR